MRDFIPQLSSAVSTSALFPLNAETSGIMKMKIQKIIKGIETTKYVTDVFDSICIPI